MLVLVNGDYVPQGNGLQSAKGDEAVEQVTLAENGGKASLTVNAVKDERRLTAEMALGQEGVTM